MKKKCLFVIHGAWSTNVSFTCLINALERDDIIISGFEYTCRERSISEIVDSAIQKLYTLQDTDVTIVGHSLGGIIGLAISHCENVKNVITVASPLNGLDLPWLFKLYLYSRVPFLSDIFEGSEFMQNLHRKNIPCSVYSVVADKGYSPIHQCRTDGVISYRAQTKWMPQNAKIEHINANHHEILQTQRLTELVNKVLS